MIGLVVAVGMVAAGAAGLIYLHRSDRKARQELADLIEESERELEESEKRLDRYMLELDRKDQEPTRWEYLHLMHWAKGLSAELNSLGSEGWEVVDFKYVAGSKHYAVLLKRELKG